jgi:hypothetical protein
MYEAKHSVRYTDGSWAYRIIVMRKGIPMVNRLGRWVEVQPDASGTYNQITPIDFNDGVGRISVAEQTRLAAHAAINVNSVAEHLGMRAMGATG